jgi:undecaprenyl-diphosphatase
MSLIEAFILGIVQGLTEFLPVSSSGHIEIVKALFDAQVKEGLLLTIVLHLATALSTLVIFRKTIVDLVKGLFQKGLNPEKKYIILILISMVPAAFVGLFWEDKIETLFSENLMLVGIMLLLTGMVLWISDKAKKSDHTEISNSRAALMGIVQAIAILPGISRSGSTIASGVMLGLRRDVAAKFSFIMVLPLILGASVKKFMEFQSAGPSGDELSIATLLVGFSAAFISGLLALRWMIRLVEKSQLKWFALYCFAVGIISILSVLF